jgi:hypothetical protein
MRDGGVDTVQNFTDDHVQAAVTSFRGNHHVNGNHLETGMLVTQTSTVLAEESS